MHLTKSRFKQGLECPTKLFYTNKKDEYANASIRKQKMRYYLLRTISD